VSVAATAPEAPAVAFRPPTTGEACPLCGALLHPEQEWCLSCGAAARTRLAAAPRWRGLVVVVAVIVVLCLGVLAAALVKLAGSSSATAPGTTTIVTAPASATQAPGTAG
jgi:RNA polymerase subunit RPABC4/transcription elongation factor Spt4